MDRPPAAGAVAHDGEAQECNDLIAVGLATDEDDSQLRRLLCENPMHGQISVSLEREPNAFYAAGIEGDFHQMIVAKDTAEDRIIGMGSRALRAAFVNGQVRRLGMLSQLRIDHRYRRRRAPLVQGYSYLRSLHDDRQTPYYITSIIADNLAARRLLEAGLRGFPTYQKLEPLNTYVIPLGRKRRYCSPGAIRLARGSRRILEAIIACVQRNGQRYQFCPRWTAEDICSPIRTRGLEPENFYVAMNGDRVIGCLARWDQQSFKQTVVRGYAPSLGRWRPVINLMAPWIGTGRLPRIGQQLNMTFVSHVAVDDDAPNVFLRLLEEVYRDCRHQRYESIVLGFAKRAPLARVIEKWFPSREYASILYLVHWGDATDAVSALDNRVPHVEVATL